MKKMYVIEAMRHGEKKYKYYDECSSLKAAELELKDLWETYNAVSSYARFRIVPFVPLQRLADLQDEMQQEIDELHDTITGMSDEIATLNDELDSWEAEADGSI